MFKNLLKKKETQDDKMDKSLRELITKIDKMNLTEMRSYVNGNIKDLEVTAEGLNVVLERLVKVDSTTSKSYINSDDMDSKKKKAFNLVLTIMGNKKINIETIELVQKFLEVYEEMINEFDREYKDIYSSRFKDAIESGLAMIGVLSDMEKKIQVLS